MQVGTVKCSGGFIGYVSPVAVPAHARWAHRRRSSSQHCCAGLVLDQRDEHALLVAHVKRDPDTDLVEVGGERLGLTAPPWPLDGLSVAEEFMVLVVAAVAAADL